MTLSWGCTCWLGLLSARRYPDLGLCRVGFIHSLSQRSVKRSLVAPKKTRGRQLSSGRGVWNKPCRCPSEKGRACPRGSGSASGRSPPAAQCRSPVRSAQVDELRKWVHCFHPCFLGVLPRTRLQEHTTDVPVDLTAGAHSVFEVLMSSLAPRASGAEKISPSHPTSSLSVQLSTVHKAQLRSFISWAWSLYSVRSKRTWGETASFCFRFLMCGLQGGPTSHNLTVIWFWW